MPRVKMTDTTHHSAYGEMLAGTVHEVSDEDAARFVLLGIATKTTARTTAEVARLAAEPPAEEAPVEEEAPVTGPAHHEPVAMDRGDVAGLTGAEPVQRLPRHR